MDHKVLVESRRAQAHTLMKVNMRTYQILTNIAIEKTEKPKNVICSGGEFLRGKLTF